MKPLAALALILATLAALTYEATYTDASGADCVALSAGRRELDLCTGRTDR